MLHFEQASQEGRAATGHGLTPTIPLEVLFGNPERTMPRVDPEGKRLAYLAPHEGVLNVWVRTIGGKDDKVVTRDTKRGITQYFWAEDNVHLVYLQDRDGDENWHIYAVNLNSMEIRDLTPFEGIHAQIVETNPDFPDEILVALNIRDRRFHDVYKIRLQSGREELVVENPGDVLSWVADHKLQIRGCLLQTEDGGFHIKVRDDINEEWRPLVTWTQEEGFPEIYGFAPGGQSIYLGDPRDWNSTRLVELSCASGEISVIAQDMEYDVDGVLIHPTKHYLQAVAFYRDRREWIAIDERVKGDFQAIQTVNSGDFVILSRNKEDTVWLVSFTQDNHPVSYYSYDRDTGKATFLFTSRPELDKYLLAHMKPIVLEARDGLTLHGYLTLPPGIPSKSLPMVLNVHGGPWGRDVWGLHPEAQWLADRGYACLQINYRGSTGYGKKFLNAGNREWGAKMQDDLTDAVNWAVSQGIADPKRVAIYGGSYGGYAALAGAAFTPDVFACSVDMVGPSSIVTLIRSFPPYWTPMKNVFIKRVGDPDEEEEFLRSRSPLFSADKIRIPLLIAQGANDPRVTRIESEQIVEALKRNGRDVEYLLYPDEGHGLVRPENRLHFYRAMENFLAKYLGGRVEGERA